MTPTNFDNVRLYTEPQEGKTYTIEKTLEKDVDTPDGEKPVVIINFKNNDKNPNVYISTTLWVSDNASLFSKFGAFLYALGTDVSKWTGKTIKFINWQSKNREIEVIS